MRIALVSTERSPVPPLRGGAVQTYIAEVAPYLARRHEVTVIGVSDPDLPPREVRDGVRYVRLDAPAGDGTAYGWALIDYVSRHAFDVIEVFNRPLWVLPLHAACPGARLVLSLHNEMMRETKIPLDLAAPTLKVLSRIVTVSDYIARSVVSRYPEAAAKVTTLYSGVDVDRFPRKGPLRSKALRKAMRKEMGFGDDPVILYVGRLSRNKGPHVLLDAMPDVLRRHPRARLVMVGSRWFGTNETDDYVQALQEKVAPLGDHVVLTGYVPYDEVHRYFAMADVFVCSSQWAEPLARVHYEAMAAGLPIVTTERGGNPELVRSGIHGIILEQWHDPRAFAQAINDILDNPDMARAMGKAGRKLVERRFTFRRLAARLEEVLEEAGEARPPAPVDEIRLDSGLLMGKGGDPHTLMNELPYARTVLKLRQRTHTVLEMLHHIRVRQGAEED